MLYPGLKGVTAVETELSDIDGKTGRLYYRHQSVEEIVGARGFEEVCYFLLEGEFPDSRELQWMKELLVKERSIDNELKAWIEQLTNKQSIVATIRSAISCLDRSKDQWPIQTSEAIRLIAKLPTVVAYSYRSKMNLKPVEPLNELDHVENFLYMLFGTRKTREEVRALEAYMVLTAEHGMNASTFASRVVISTGSDLYSAVIAAIGALKGPLHGGAPTGVLDYIEDVKHQPVEEVIRKKLTNHEKVMGFGHRVYKAKDPRAEALKAQLMKIEPKPNWVDFTLKVESETVNWLDELKPGRKLYANVEFYAAALMKAIEIPADLFTPIFCSSRIVGWSAHIMEQSRNNTIFRPAAKYKKSE
ncbi:citrate/2-methylcitrate synthase [Halobacillus shinanisalinarum]|uniref:Citrate synthase n=1 Tax=Halobacillus shinanisalinarum TaxID=2932258 RepID=A0ABY4GZY9_9BACI|nr:citrate/2-methylcitrate synthase [Halobacillus shinanisalinarum]UOQ93483.1 citrate/2-methylcitrate synthase [Halobacillus shinanisalinarum]